MRRRRNATGVLAGSGGVQWSYVLYRVVADRLRRRWAGPSARHVMVHAVPLEVSASQRGYALRTLYRVRAASQATANPVFLDTLDAPLRVEEVLVADDYTVDRERLGYRGAMQITEVVPRADGVGHDCEIQVTLDWIRRDRAGREITCFVAPDFVPTPVVPPGNAASGGRPDEQALRIGGPAIGLGVEVGGVRVARGVASGSAGPWLQAVCVAMGGGPDWADEVNSARVMLAPGFSNGLSIGDGAKVVAFVERVADFFASLCGVHPGRFVVARPAEVGPGYRVPPGSIVLLHSPSFTIEGPPMAQDRDRVVRQMARAWWGVGYRAAGPFSHEIVLAITTAMMLLWLDWQGERNHAELWRRSLLRLAGSSWLGERLAVLRVRTRPRIFGPLAARLYEALAAEPVACEALKDLTVANWGRVVQTAALLDWFRDVGVELPSAIADRSTR